MNVTLADPGAVAGLIASLPKAPWVHVRR